MEEDCCRCQQWCPYDPEGSGTQVTCKINAAVSLERLKNAAAVQAICADSPAARGVTLQKYPPNQVIDDFGRGSSV